jgi:hypothetical protein
MAPAFSEARNAAVAATSASCGERRVIRIWSRLSIRPWKAVSELAVDRGELLPRKRLG